MTTMMVKLRVAEFDKWKAAFDSSAAMRRENGWISHTIHRDPADPNVVVVAHRVQDAARAKAFVASPEVRAMLANAGVQGPPEVMMLEVAEEFTY